jgi:hypothetical protein
MILLSFMLILAVSVLVTLGSFFFFRRGRSLLEASLVTLVFGVSGSATCLGAYMALSIFYLRVVMGRIDLSPTLALLFVMILSGAAGLAAGILAARFAGAQLERRQVRSKVQEF